MTDLQNPGCPWVQAYKSPTEIPIVEYNPSIKYIQPMSTKHYVIFYLALFSICSIVIVAEFVLG